MENDYFLQEIDSHLISYRYLKLNERIRDERKHTHRSTLRCKIKKIQKLLGKINHNRSNLGDDNKFLVCEFGAIYVRAFFPAFYWVLLLIGDLRLNSLHL